MGQRVGTASACYWPSWGFFCSSHSRVSIRYDIPQCWAMFRKVLICSMKTCGKAVAVSPCPGEEQGQRPRRAHRAEQRGGPHLGVDGEGEAPRAGAVHGHVRLLHAPTPQAGLKRATAGQPPPAPALPGLTTASSECATASQHPQGGHARRRGRSARTPHLPRSLLTSLSVTHTSCWFSSHCHHSRSPCLLSTALHQNERSMKPGPGHCRCPSYYKAESPRLVDEA